MLADTATRAARLSTRSSEGWSEEYAEGEGLFTAHCFGLELSLDSIYERLRFDAE